MGHYLLNEESKEVWNLTRKAERSRPRHTNSRSDVIAVEQELLHGSELQNLVSYVLMPI